MPRNVESISHSPVDQIAPDKFSYLDRIGKQGDIYTYLRDRQPPIGWPTRHVSVPDATPGTIIEFTPILPMVADE